MTIRPFVLLAKRLCERGKSRRVQRIGGGDRDGQLEGLALVVQVGSTPDVLLLRCKAVRSELRVGVRDQTVPGSTQFLQVQLVKQTAEGACIMVRDIGVQEAKRRK